MATINARQVWTTKRVSTTAWLAIPNTSTGTPESASRLLEKSVQIAGTFGAGGSVTIQGSNEGSNWVTLHNPQGNALTLTAPSLEKILENTLYIRPNVTAGDGTTALNVYLTAATDGREFPLANNVSALFDAKTAITNNLADVSFLIIGDSTGNETTEWPYLFAQWLALQYPTHSVSYRLWNDAGNVYDAAIVVSTGSGANTIRIWNASIAGTQPIYLMGDKLAPATGVTPTPSLVIWNHGHNLVSSATDSLYRGGFIQAMDQVRQTLPGVAHAAIRQNPWRDADSMSPVVSQLDSIALAYTDMAVIDVYSRFIALNKASSLYLDNVHPSASGSQLFLQAMQEAWLASDTLNASSFAAFVGSLGTNLLTGVTKFSDPAYVGGQPAGWINTTTTFTADATIFDAGATQSMKFVNTTAGAAIYQQIDATALRGKMVTFAVRQYVPAGSAATVGRIAILYNDGVTNTTIAIGLFGNQANAGWRWVMIAGVAIPTNAVYLRAYLYCDTAANASSAVYYDRAILVEGNIPKNIA